MARIYTRTGDTGQTGLFGGGRVPKSHRRVAAYGDVDELNAVLGWVLLRIDDAETAERLRLIQSDLFALGAHLATPAGARSGAHLPPLPTDRATAFESWIDAAEAELEPLRSFILPGGGEAGAALHVARTVCRRAERLTIALARSEAVGPFTVKYLNRLSDALFVMARYENRKRGVEDVCWDSRA